MRSTMYEKAPFCSLISFLVYEFSPITIHFSYYLKSLISRINEVYVFFNEISL